MKELFLSSKGLLPKRVLVLLFLVLGTTTVFAQICGDANQDGRISIVDSLVIAQDYVGIYVPVINVVNADVDGNGSATIIDALIIAQYTVGLISVFPGPCPGGDDLVADFTISNTIPAVNGMVSFDAAASAGNIVSYDWDFDDGTTGSGIRVNHVFTDLDDFKVELTVTDSNGNSDDVKKRVFVGRPQGWTEETHHKSADGNYELLFSRDKVNRLDITISPRNYQIMEDDLAQMSMFNIPTPVYVPSTVEFNGHTWLNVGIRYKGQSTLMAATQGGKHKLPFHLNFDKFEDEYPEIKNQRFYGFKELLGNSNWFDSSFLRDYMCTEIFLNGGTQAARCAYYRIYIDTGRGPEYWGLYTVFEDHGDEMLKTQFDDNDGNLYKPELTGADWNNYVQDAFVKKTNKDEADYSDVRAAVTALNSSRSNAAAWRSNLEEVLNVDSFIRWLAINTAIENVDSYGTTMQNYFLYQDLADNGRLVWIPWDFNLSMDFEYGFMFQPLSLSLDEVSGSWPLIRYLMDDPVYNERYHQELRAAVDGCFRAEPVIAEMRRVHSMIRPYVVGSQGETSTYTFLTGGSNEFDDALTSLVNHVNSRQSEVRSYLNSH